MSYSSQISKYTEKNTGRKLGLGTVSRQNYSNVFITGGEIQGLATITISDSDYVGGTISNASLSNVSISNSRIYNVSIADSIITNSTFIGDITGHASEDLKVSNNLSEVTASIARTNLSLGTISTQNNNAVLITGGSISGTSFSGNITGVASGNMVGSNNLSEIVSRSAAKTNLSLGTAANYNIGTGALSIVQLDSLSRLPAVDGSQLTNLPGGGGSGTFGNVDGGSASEIYDITMALDGGSA